MLLSLSEAKNKLLELLIYFDKVCKDHKVDYWIDGGTLLGAVRNGKFIDWDDDIDVCLLVDDYHKIREILKKENKKTKHYFLYNNCRPYNNYSDFLGDTSVIKSNLLPIRIDLMMVKSIKSSEKLMIEKDKEILNILKFYQGFNYNFNLVKDKWQHYFLDKSFNSRKKFISFFNNYINGLNNTGIDYKLNYNFGDIYVNKEREWYEFNEIFPLSQIKFENITFNCPNNTDLYLKKLYGKDYLIPPPANKQIPYSSFYIKNFLPKSVTKKLIYIIYFLKEFKNWFRVLKRVKKYKSLLNNNNF